MLETQLSWRIRTSFGAGVAGVVGSSWVETVTTGRRAMSAGVLREK